MGLCLWRKSYSLVVLRTPNKYGWRNDHVLYEREKKLPENWKQLYDFSKVSYNMKNNIFYGVYDRFPSTSAELKEFSDRVNAGWKPEPINVSYGDETEIEEEFFWNMDLTVDVDVNFDLFRELNRYTIKDIYRLGKEVMHMTSANLPQHLWIIKDKCGLVKADQKTDLEFTLKRCACSGDIREFHNIKFEE